MKHRPINLKIALAISLAVIPILPVVAQRTQQVRPVDLVADAREKLAEGRERFDDSSLREAIDQARRALDGNPRYAEAHLVLAESYLWLGQLEDVTPHIEAARRFGYRGTDLQLLAARTAVLSGDFTQGEEIYAAVLDREPYNENARVGLSLLGLIDGASTIERREFDRLEARYPENRQLLVALIEMSDREGDVDGVQRYLEPALRFHGDSASVQYVAATNALRNGNLSAATVHGRNAVTIAPTLSDGWLLLAEIARRRGDLPAARAHYETLIRLEPDNYRAWYARGVIAHSIGDYENAIRSWERSRSIRPDYELPVLALEHDAIDRFPLESSWRSERAVPYLRMGKALEGRYFFRQAEQLYRSGLQIYPYDISIRRALAEMYRNQEMYGRYLQELEIIAQLSDPSQEVSDLIEVFRDFRKDSLAVTWDVDQFVIDRPLTRVLLTYSPATDTLEPQGSAHVARYLQRLLQSSQKIEALDPVEIDSTRATEVVRTGRRNDSEITAGLDISAYGDRLMIEYSLFEGSSMVPIRSGTVIRSGNERIRNAARELAARIEGTVVPQGVVVDRRFETVLVGIGRGDGVSPGDEIRIVTVPGNRDIGTGSVTAVDDLLATIDWNPNGADRLGIGDKVIYIGPNESDGDASSEAAESVADAIETEGEEVGNDVPSDQPVSFFEELVQQIFSVR